MPVPTPAGSHNVNTELVAHRHAAGNWAAAHDHATSAAEPQRAAPAVLTQNNATTTKVAVAVALGEDTPGNDISARTTSTRLDTAVHDRAMPAAEHQREAPAVLTLTNAPSTKVAVAVALGKDTTGDDTSARTTSTRLATDHSTPVASPSTTGTTTNATSTKHPAVLTLSPGPNNMTARSGHLCGAALSDWLQGPGDAVPRGGKLTHATATSTTSIHHKPSRPPHPHPPCIGEGHLLDQGVVSEPATGDATGMLRERALGYRTVGEGEQAVGGREVLECS
jgi:hypothetical protein